MYTYTSVRSPQWADAAHTVIDCFVKFEQLKVEVPFTANPNDVESHGREIFARCAAGDFGQVAPYAPKPAPAEIVNEGGVSNLLHGWPEIYDFIRQANAEVARGTPRGIILVWSAMIEAVLGRILESFLVDHAKSRELIWDDAQSSLGTFSGRSKVCFALGLITQRELMMCDKIRAVRNLAAHEWNVDLTNKAFRTKAIPALKALYDADPAQQWVWNENDLEFLVLQVYASSCSFLLFRLAQRLVDIAEERRPQRNDP
ncbi:hypothetical protein PZ895_06180 [Mesorhizobium sp. YIM 152430]|uniref:hypothetical protein n=1 Tax=Mesorhizobium sp. YIM 152430 TaxID=3031761 RepID=UPI0023DC45BB|nr:hypothetical protein [Mesorhizobium sp. YIM 152430]MDF1599365.1 hypothetical protein [Mesorhizobium sp. YIM 152430]